MRNLVYYSLGLIVLALSLNACGNQEKKNQAGAGEEETVKEVMPEVILENDYVKVVKVSLDPGEALASHQGEVRVIYSLTDYSIDWEEQGKQEGNKSWSRGDVHFHEAGQHSAINNGTTTAEWLAFTRKDVALPECGENTIENDVNSVASEFTNLLWDNDNYRITEVGLPIGESIPTHAGINRIIYSLTDYQIMYESNKEGNSEKKFQAGDVHWHEACQHALQNNGATEANFLVVSYK